MSARTSNFLDNKSVRIFFFFLTLVLGVIYFVQITSVSSRGIELRNLSKKQSALANETHRIELFIAEESSAQKLQKRVSELGLVTAGKVEYLKADGNSVAMK
jgi:hypothetical protein